MKIFLFLTLNCLSVLSLKAHERDRKATLVIKPDSVYTMGNVDSIPVYPGGNKEFHKYVRSTIILPASAKKTGINGRIILSFIIEKDGSITTVKILRGLSPDLDAEAIRVVTSSPKWQAGTINKKPVRVQNIMPISFSIFFADLTHNTISNSTKDSSAFQPIEKTPEFPGGWDKFTKYIKDNLKYPEKARQDNVEGNVRVTFVVEKNGSLTEITITKSLSLETDAEAFRLITNSPKWNPGIQNGHPVRVQYTIPISFSLNN